MPTDHHLILCAFQMLIPTELKSSTNNLILSGLSVLV